MKPYLKNLDDVEWTEMSHGKRFHSLRKPLTPKDGTRPKLGASVYRLLPGKRSFPRHEHMVNDEAILVLQGEGTLIYGDEEVALRAGDYVHLPANSGAAHQVHNTSAAELEYLCFSTMIEPEISLYPDSDKIGAFAGSAPGGDITRRRVWAYMKSHTLPYWEGESEE
ncbi:MAG: cupin domain-containing protein [Sphingomonadales bacterium]|nr:cupin domain-containing protein [Sphingomonadales bacterium]